MHELHTEIDIEATPETVWWILTNFAVYPEWNPFIRQVMGVAQPGTKLMVRIHPSGAKAMSFRLTVLAVERPRELRWLGRFYCLGFSTVSINSNFKLWPRACDSRRANALVASW